MGNISKEFLEKQRQERIGCENYNKKGELMKVVEYYNSHNVIVEFQDKHKRQTTVYWKSFIEGKVRNPYDYEIFNNRLGSEKLNNQGYLMKVIVYNNRHDIIVEFQDKYKAKIHSDWGSFNDGTIRNPYCPNVLGIGIVGNKYHTSKNGKLIKEYITWVDMLRRCYDEEYIKDLPTYYDCSVCDEWLLYENFYEWLHSQDNFDKWKKIRRSALDKDIIVKGNKFYSPSTCCLVTQNINVLFAKRDAKRGDLPIGVIFYKPYKKYRADCHNAGKGVCIKYCNTPQEAFNEYKQYKEKLIKQIAQEEYNKGNITKRCYDAMMNYQVEITD